MNNESYIRITLSNLVALLARANVLVTQYNADAPPRTHIHPYEHMYANPTSMRSWLDNVVYNKYVLIMI
jgi:hypothetical protein